MPTLEPNRSNKTFFTDLFGQLAAVVESGLADDTDAARLREYFYASLTLEQLCPDLAQMTSALATYAQWLPDLARAHEILADAESRRIMVSAILSRIAGPARVRMPMATSEAVAELERIEQQTDWGNTIMGEIRQEQSPLALMPAGGCAGNSTRLYSVPVAVYVIFVLEQYILERNGVRIAPNPGDVVIDAGACWGETALYFAEKVGATGRVFSFEFIPANVRILEQNLALNPDLAERVTVVPNALYDQRGFATEFAQIGPSSRLIPERHRGGPKAITDSLDALLKDGFLDRVNYIKMDIEGAELPALKGAERAIREFRPQLAISIYHRMSDPALIPLYLDSLDLGYRFYVDHYTPLWEETILYCSV